MAAFNPTPAYIRAAAKKKPAAKPTSSSGYRPPTQTSAQALALLHGLLAQVPGSGGSPSGGPPTDTSHGAGPLVQHPAVAPSTPMWALNPDQQSNLVANGAGAIMVPVYTVTLADGTSHTQLTPPANLPPGATSAITGSTLNPSYHDATAEDTSGLGFVPGGQIADIQAKEQAALAQAKVQTAQILMDQNKRADVSTNQAISRGLLNSSITNRDLSDISAAAEQARQSLHTNLALLQASDIRQIDSIISGANLVSHTALAQGALNAQNATPNPGSPTTWTYPDGTPLPTPAAAGAGSTPGAAPTPPQHFDTGPAQPTPYPLLTGPSARSATLGTGVAAAPRPAVAQSIIAPTNPSQNATAAAVTPPTARKRAGRPKAALAVTGY